MWITAALPGWLASQTPPIVLPAEVDDLQVRFTSSGITLGARISTGFRAQAVSARIGVDVRPDGSLWIPVRSLTLGRLPVPASLLIEQFGGQSPRNPGDNRANAATGGLNIVAMLQGDAPAVQQAQIRLADGRRVRVLRIEPRDGEVWITLQTFGADSRQ